MIGESFELEDNYSPTVLASIFGVNQSEVYKLIKQGRLPAECTYREALRSYINFWKFKSKAKRDSMSEIALARRAELDRVRIEQGWFGLRKERGLLISKEEFIEVFSPIYLQIRDQLRALIKRHPKLREEIDSILSSWADLGDKYQTEVKQDLDTYVENQMQELEKLEEFIRLETEEATKISLQKSVKEVLSEEKVFN